MDEKTRVEIELACHRLSIAYARHVDFGEYDEFADLFAEDGWLDVGQPIKGRENIRQSMGRRPDTLRSRHVLTNIHIQVTNADQASGISYLTLYRHIGEESLDQTTPIEFEHPAGVGHYTDEFVRTEKGWRFASRKLALAFRNSAKF